MRKSKLTYLLTQRKYLVYLSFCECYLEIREKENTINRLTLKTDFS